MVNRCYSKAPNSDYFVVVVINVDVVALLVVIGHIILCCGQ